jgi:general secretion pathway protein D
MSPQRLFLRNRRYSVQLSGIACALVLAGCSANRLHWSGMRELDAGNYTQAVAELQRAAELSPQDVVFRKDWLTHRDAVTQRLLTQAENFLHTGDTAGAEKQYATILEYDRANPRALAGLDKLVRMRRAARDVEAARTALKDGDQRQAAELAARALDNDPEQAEARAIRRELNELQAKQFTAAPTLDAVYQKPVNLEFRDASVKMVFDALTRTTGINFVFDRDTRSDQRTTVLLRQTTLEDAIDVILATNQLEKKVLNSTSVLIYNATPAKVKEYQELVVRAFYLASAEAKNTANLLKTVLKVNEVFVDEKMNMLVLREPPQTIALAEKLIRLHDLDQPEVMLEVEVLEINRSRLLDAGIKITDKFTIQPLSTAALKLSEFSSLGKSQLGITSPSATITLNADNRDSNLLANPRIRVRDREKARFMIGDKVPVITTTNSAVGFSSENIAYQDVGLKIEVEPEIRLRDEVGLRLSLEVSSLVSSIKTNNGSLAYQIGTRSVSSALRLKDGETQVLAGLISDEERSSANGLPFLNELPLIGRLFAAKQDNRNKTEIVLSITPHLIRNIRRNEPEAESFWSGTEANLRVKPLQVRIKEEGPAAGGTRAQSGTAPASVSASPPARAQEPPAAPVPGAPELRWKAPPQVKVGETIDVELYLSSPDDLRATSMQIGFDPGVLEVVSVKEGDFFSQVGEANFSHSVDKGSGRIYVGSASGSGKGAKAEARLLSLQLRPLREASQTQLDILSLTPIGHAKTVPMPAMPLSYTLKVIQ